MSDRIEKLHQKYDEAYERGDFVTAAHYDELIKNCEKAELMRGIKITNKSTYDDSRLPYLQDRPADFN